MRWTVATLLLFSVHVHAARENNEGSEFKIAPDLVNKIYREASSEAGVDTSRVAAGVVVTPQLSFFTPGVFDLTNNYYEMNYASDLGAVPRFALNLGLPIGYAGGFTFTLSGQVSYAYKEGLFNGKLKVSNRQTRSTVKLHWLPIAGIGRIDYHIPGVRFVRPYATGGVGAQWLYQSGVLDGLEQGFWIPFFQAGFGLTFLDRLQGSSDWFGGFNVGITRHRSLSADQTVEGWSVDLGASLLL